MYRFLNNENVEPASFSASYRKGLVQWVRALPEADKPSRMYLFQDSTFGKYNGRKTELGYMETGSDNGVLIHNAVLTDDYFVPLGLPVQQFIVRDYADFGKSAQRAARPFEEKES